MSSLERFRNILSSSTLHFFVDSVPDAAWAAFAPPPFPLPLLLPMMARLRLPATFDYDLDLSADSARRRQRERGKTVRRLTRSNDRPTALPRWFLGALHRALHPFAYWVQRRPAVMMLVVFLICFWFWVLLGRDSAPTSWNLYTTSNFPSACEFPNIPTRKSSREH